jgi:hypothetical protein
MCYSAQIEADYKKMAREFGATMDLSAFTELWLAENSPGPRKIPKALADSLLICVDLQGSPRPMTPGIRAPTTLDATVWKGTGERSSVTRTACCWRTASLST